jgi:hypothetical protein
MLDERVGSMENLELNVEDEELVIDTEVSLPELIDEVEQLDSMVHQKVLELERIESVLTTLNEYLDSIKTFAEDVRGSANFGLIGILEDRKKKISTIIEQKLK